jgi:hypothetical protein
MLKEIGDRLWAGAAAKALAGFVLVLSGQLLEHVPLRVVTLVFVLVVVDTTLGFGRAAATRTVDSGRLYRGAIKFGVYTCLVLLGAALELVSEGVPGVGAISAWWVEWILSYLALTEAVSILEHLADFAEHRQVDLPGVGAVLRLLKSGKRKLEKQIEE